MTAPVIAVFGASAAVPGDGTYEQGVECGRMLAEAGYGVVTGGYGGLMEAVSKGANGVGGRVLGVTVPDLFTTRSGANEFVTEEWRAAHLVERIHELTEVSAGAVVLPGSLGTMTELAVAWNLAFVADRFGGTESKPIVAVGRPWGEIVEFLTARLATDGALVTVVDGVADAVDEIRRRVPL
jgi:uncharacterized protein (TIGR00730 family)